ncbi:MAG: nitrogenase component 1 [Oscillospiraceae bacterium]
MGLHRFKPLPSGRMGTLWALATIRNAAVVEFGCMGHMLYSGVTLENSSVRNACKRYSTHIDETDIALGGTGKLAATIANVVEKDNPRLIFLLPSSIPEVNGTDLPAEAKTLQKLYSETLLLPFGHGGFEATQHQGIKGALLLLAKALPKETARTPRPTFNIIGSCADLFRFQADANEILRIMEGAFGAKPVCVFTSNTSVQQIENMASAHLNLVIRREGEAAAEHLQKRFGTPYIVGRPYGFEATMQWLRQVEEVLKTPLNSGFVVQEQNEWKELFFSVGPMVRHLVQEHPEEAALSAGAHADIVQGLLQFGCGELHLPRGTFWCDAPEMHSDEIPYFTEDKWAEAVQKQTKGLLMASGEALEWAGKNRTLQISNPDTRRRLNPYVPPFMGFRGAINLLDLWVNAVMEQENEE